GRDSPGLREVVFLVYGSTGSGHHRIRAPWPARVAGGRWAGSAAGGGFPPARRARSGGARPAAPGPSAPGPSAAALGPGSEPAGVPDPAPEPPHALAPAA